MKKDLKVLELFSGIRAVSVALNKLGVNYEIVDSVEIDKHAIASQNAMFGTNFEPQDISKWDKELDVDLLLHGSPCQDFSIAGKQDGGEEDSGTRSSLLYETIRIVEKNKPKVVIWENVKNVLSAKHKHVFDDYLNKMEELGYNNQYQVLNAKDYGIPQNRERVFAVSIRNDVKKVFTFPEPQPLDVKLKDFLQDNPIDSEFYLSEDKIKRIANWKAYQKPFKRVLGNESICPTITARGAGEDHSGMILLSKELANNTDLQECIVGDFRYDEGFRVRKNGLSPCLKTNSGSGLSGTLVVTDTSINNLEIRKLTPLECWRLMGFPDEYFYKAQSSGVTKSQLYKQAGNSIVVNVLEAILEQLLF